MVDVKSLSPRLGRTGKLRLGGAVLLALGAAGGASAVAATRPDIEMAPRVAVPIASLPQRDGVVTVKGRVTDVYGDRFVVADRTGKTMVAAGRDRLGTVTAGQPLLVQGRYDDGQLRASFLVSPDGQVEAVGPVGPRRGPGPDDHGPGGPRHDGPPAPPPGGPGHDGPPPPPPPGGPGAGSAACPTRAGTNGAPPPPPVAASMPTAPR